VSSASITVFSGRFGSGKTEASINFAVRLAQGWNFAPGGWERSDGKVQPLLVDLDIVTTYFRSRETRDAMAKLGVEVVEPSAHSRHLDLPAVSGEILGAIEQQGRPVVVDLGGDPQGARALGQYSGVLSRGGYRGLFVVNPFRPFTATVEAIEKSLRSVEATARLSMTALVSNPNLMAETTIKDVINGHRLVRQASLELGLPVALMCLHANAPYLSERWEDGTPVLPIRRYMELDWFSA
jgi:hypothetical protein